MSDSSSCGRELWLFLRAHRIVSVMAVGSALLTIEGIWGQLRIDVPGSAGAPWQFRHLIGIILSALAISLIGSSVAELELSAARRVPRMALAAGLITAGLFLGVSVCINLYFSDGTDAAIQIRCFIAWVGLSLLGTRLWDASAAAMLLPLIGFVPLTYFQFGAGLDGMWWNWLEQPVASWSWAVVGALLVVGLASSVATRWRLHSLLALLRRIPGRA